MSPTVPESTTVSVGKWFEDLLDKLFYQPDDDVALKAFEDDVAKEFTARVNQDEYTREQFLEMVKEIRGTDDMSVQSNRELISWPAGDQAAGEGAGGGCVAHLSAFTCVSKKDESKTVVDSLTVADVRIIDGRRALVHLREVANY